MVFLFYKVAALPDKGFDKNIFIESAGGAPLAVVYDLREGFTAFGIDSRYEDRISFASRNLPGLEFSKLEGYGSEQEDLEVTSIFRKKDTLLPNTLGDVFGLGETRGVLGVVFLPVIGRELHESKRAIERALEKMGVRETTSFTNGNTMGRASSSLQKDIMSNSEERLLLGEVLESINNAVLSGATPYKIGLVFNKSDRMEKYVKAKFLTFEEFEKRIRLENADELKLKAFPVGPDKAVDMMGFYRVNKLNYVIKTEEPESRGDIKLGTFMDDGVYNTGSEVSIDGSIFNLGTIITGLPGSGKTMEAMQSVGAVLNNRTRRVLVIAPTDEWNEFAKSNGMHLIRVYNDPVPINFFRCAGNIERSVFYEDLAMLLSSASDAGPYRNPMEKCMLNAFKRIYEKESDPDPIAAYEEIEEAVIRLHAKRTNTGVKYTKHGENIKSALENLRSILHRPEYSSRQGIRFEELMERGAVFDLSRVSNKFKPYLYALLLNQAYMLANLLDNYGDDELRMLICLEEAQIVLGQRQSNAAAEDLKYRIQDFRKKGVGLMLLAHNVDDIEKSIRRLCQIKLYLKQAPDIAETAAEDLVFTHAERDEVISKLKHLDSRIGALSYIVKDGNEKTAKDTIFIRTMDFEAERRAPGSTGANSVSAWSYREVFTQVPEVPKEIETTISINLRKDEAYSKGELPAKNRLLTVRINFLCEMVSERQIECREHAELKEEMLKGRPYKIEVLDERKKIICSKRVFAQEKIDIDV